MCSCNKLQKHQRKWVKLRVSLNKTRYLAENRQKSLKNRQNFRIKKKSVKKHLEEAIEPLKSKIGQFMWPCSSNKLQKHLYFYGPAPPISFRNANETAPLKLKNMYLHWKSILQGVSRQTV